MRIARLALAALLLVAAGGAGVFGATWGVVAAGIALAVVLAWRSWHARRGPGDLERWYGARAAESPRTDPFARSSTRAAAGKREEDEGAAAQAAHERRWARLLPFALLVIAGSFLWTPARAVGTGATYALAAVMAAILVGALLVARSTNA